MKALINVKLGIVFPVAGMIGLQAMLATGERGQASEAVEGFTAQGIPGLPIRTGLHHENP
jgi:hypothetical protein